MNWFKRSTKVTASTARRITGISTPLGGIQWADPGPSEAEMVRGFLVFLEDRRVLYNAMQLEVPDQVERSIHEIREECTRTLQRLGANAFAAPPPSHHPRGELPVSRRLQRAVSQHGA